MSVSLSPALPYAGPLSTGFPCHEPLPQASPCRRWSSLPSGPVFRARPSCILSYLEPSAVQAGPSHSLQASGQLERQVYGVVLLARSHFRTEIIPSPHLCPKLTPFLHRTCPL